MTLLRIFPFIMAFIMVALAEPLHAQAEERKEVRLLYDFENASELEELKAGGENATFDIVQDNGVTHGQNCCRMVFAKGGDYSVFKIDSGKLKGWGNFDYIAFDIFQEAGQKTPFAVELWDAASKNYATRCTYENNIVRQGKNTIVVQINHSKRNNKEGRTWEELQPQDKIDLNGLVQVKCFLQTPRNSDLVWWVDNIRLLQEDALGGKMHLELPPDAKAFKLGHPGVSLHGFTSVPAGTVFDEAKGFGISGSVENIGKAWPDPLTGAGILDTKGGEFSFETRLPDGEYWVWFSAGMVLNPDLKDPNYLLRIGGETIYQDKPASEQFNGEKYLYRFMKTRYAEKNHALWRDFIDKMYASYQKKVKVAGGKLTITASNFWLASVIVMPAGEEAAFKKLASEIQSERIKVFLATMILDPQKKPQKKDGDESFTAFIPDEATRFRPDTNPSDTERARKGYDLAAAPGQNVFLRLGLTAFDDAGAVKFALSDLKGPGDIPASAARLYFMDYRVRGDAVREAALIPGSELNAEKGISWCFYAWLRVPADARAGDYTGTVTLTPTTGKTVSFPVKLKIYPFQLEAKLPYSFGMYYNPPADKNAYAGQLRFMREIGFTGTTVPPPGVASVNGEKVKIKFDQAAYDRIKEAGFGAAPLQYQMSTSLHAARAIGRRFLGLGAKIDQQPGIEMKDPRMKPLYIDYCRQFAACLKKAGLPVAVEIVDEPRETPNPWNRNLAHTNLYADWMKEAGIDTGFVTPMGDSQDGKDYTSLVDHASIISTHAGKGSERMMRKTAAAGKPLWLYNTGMDRLSWGFYNWRVGSTGRWEWHFCFHENGSNQGYYNGAEWYNPFTSCDGNSPAAPASYSGAMLFKSAYFNVAEGITDTAYIATLEKAIAATEGNAIKPEAVAKAREFLAGLKQTIPFVPDVEGIGGEAEGALVGRGLNTPEQALCESWRRKLAELIIALKAAGDQN